MATIRYLVHDVDAALDFYVSRLGFELAQRLGTARSRWSAAATSRCGCPVRARRRRGRCPTARNLRRADGTASCSKWTISIRAPLRCGPPACVCAATSSAGPGGRQLLIEDPSGNPVELFTPRGN